MQWAALLVGARAVQTAEWSAAWWVVRSAASSVEDWVYNSVVLKVDRSAALWIAYSAAGSVAKDW